jgi:hypothetical protein
MLQVSPTTSKAPMIGRESPLIVFAYGIDGPLLFQLFLQEFELRFIYASHGLCKDVKIYSGSFVVIIDILLFCLFIELVVLVRSRD